MKSIKEQIDRGWLVCPRSKQRLILDETGKYLVSADWKHRYELTPSGVPLLVLDQNEARKYANPSERMKLEYSDQAQRNMQRLAARFKTNLLHDYRTTASVKAFQEVIGSAGESALCLSIGGGPSKPNSLLVNLNIGPFPNVDVVADALELPYADSVVDAIYCEAVLEHIVDPIKAVSEMYRVLKRSGKALVITPFLQAYHGYPQHFQNFTLTGHRLLLEKAGFKILESGTCVGPVHTMVALTSTFLHAYVLGGKWLAKLWGVAGICLRPLDIFIRDRPNSYILASSTYLVAAKRE